MQKVSPAGAQPREVALEERKCRADPSDAASAGCANIVTPFDGDHEAGILVMSTSNFPDDQGPLQKLKDEEALSSANAQ